MYDCCMWITVSNFFFREFAHKLSLALIANGNTLLHTLDLNNNFIEDKGKAGTVF